MKRRGIKRAVMAYWVGAKLGYVRVQLECGHEKNATQGRALQLQREPDWFGVWRQRYAFCSRCKQ